ncbi:MAG: hypothetical protein AAGC61_02680 [Microbacterium sp.]
MSYDLDVYGKLALTARELVAVLDEGGDLTARADSDGVSSVMHARTGTAFELDGPDRIGPDDMPLGWTAAEGASVRYSIHVPYDVRPDSAAFVATVEPADLAVAAACAERLATRIGGAVFDPQTFEPPAVEAPTPERQPVPLQQRWVQLHWYRLRDGATDFAELYLRTAREMFKPGVPARFGTSEPFAGRFPRDDDEMFGSMYRDECRYGSLDFASPTIDGGTIDGWADDIRVRIQAVRLRVDLARLEKAKGVGSVERFLVTLAERAGCFFAFAEVTTRRYRTALPATPRGVDDPWSGLPTEPQWLTWFGPEYSELVRPHLDAARLKDSSSGLLLRWAEAPAVAHELRAVAGDPWIPAELRSVVDPADDERCSAAAEVMPASLRYPEPGSPLAERIAARIANARARAGLS